MLLLTSSNLLGIMIITTLKGGKIMTEEVKRKTISRIKTLRSNGDGISQEEFADMIDVSVDTVRKIEQGKVNLSLDNAIKIKNVFGVSLDWLYGVAEDMKDEASTTLLALRNHFKLCSKTHEGGTVYFTATIDSNLRDFLIEYEDAERFAEEKGFPDVAREAWLNDIKSRYNERIKVGLQGEMVDYKMIAFSDYKTSTKGANTAMPPFCK